MILDHTKLVYQLQVSSSLCVTRSCIPPLAVIYIYIYTLPSTFTGNSQQVWALVHCLMNSDWER